MHLFFEETTMCSTVLVSLVLIYEHKDIMPSTLREGEIHSAVQSMVCMYLSENGGRSYAADMLVNA